MKFTNQTYVKNDEKNNKIFMYFVNMFTGFICIKLSEIKSKTLSKLRRKRQETFV